MTPEPERCRNWSNTIGMNRAIVQSTMGVTLVGGGPVTAAALRRAMEHAPYLVAADGGADRLMHLGQQPRAVIGDLDSITPAARASLGARVHPIADQDSTDFDKALRSIEAPFVLGLGFSGARLDHGLAVLNTLVRYPDRRCLVLGSSDVTFLAPPDLALTLPVGSRFSLFPLRAVRGHSTGLRWPIDGLDFAPDGTIGTSNEVSQSRVTLSFEAPGMLIILPRRALPGVLAALSLR